jgi:hypothetical protein
MMLRASFLGAAALLAGYALQVRNGFYDETALAWLTAALCLALIGALARLPASPVPAAGRILISVLTAATIAQLLLMTLQPPGMYLRIRHAGQLTPFHIGLAIAGLLVIAGSLRIRPARAAWFPGLLAVHAALGLWLIHMSPDPAIDVVVVHEDAIAALVRGQNPYAITFRNIYADTSFYPPELVVNGRVQFGLPYPPLSLLLVAPGELLFADYRYANLAALTMAGALVGYSVDTIAARLAAALLLFTPRVFFVLEQGWTEPLVVLLLALTAFCASRAPRWTFMALGGLLAIKQYMLLAAPLALLLVPSPWWSRRGVSLLWKAAAVAAAVTLPFVAWNPSAFVRSVVLLQMYEPFRMDSLSYLAFLARQGMEPAAVWPSILAAGAAIGLALWRCRRTPSGFMMGVAVVMFVVFAFGKKAFCNYYFFVIGALCCATALLSGGGDDLRGKSAGRAATS